MAKLTKQEIKNYDKAMALLQKSTLTDDEKLFVFEHYREDAVHVNSKAGAFFTPYGLAQDFNLHLPWQYEGTIDIIDLCAGIGILSYVATGKSNSWSREYSNITCVEINPDYVEIGKKLVPEANWVCGDALDPDLVKNLGRFDCAIANPPFGRYKSPFQKHYNSSFFEYMIIEAASKIAREGVFIIPQMAAPFIYSGARNYRETGDDCRAAHFTRKTGIELEFGIGVDTNYYKGWHGVSPISEIVCCDFQKKEHALKLPEIEVGQEQVLPLPDIEVCQETEVVAEENEAKQLSLWDLAG